MRIGSNYIQIAQTWTQLKSRAQTYNLPLFYEDLNGILTVFIVDSPLVWFVALTQPNDASDITDFTNNFQSTSNQVIRARTSGKVPLASLSNDGTTLATIKAASTSPVATDPALVVSLSPNGSSVGISGVVSDGAAIGSTKPVIVGGFDGTNAQILLTDSQGRLITAPPGTNTTLKGARFGYTTIATTTPTIIRNSSYVEQSSDSQRSVVSDNANDTSAGSGARTLVIEYYTSALAGPYTTTVTLNGTTAVNTSVSDICFIERAWVATAGTGGGLTNTGIISIKANPGGTGATILSLAAGDTATRMAHHYVPSGKTCYITGLYAGIKGADTTGVQLRTKNPANTNDTHLPITEILRVPSSGGFFRSFGTAVPVTGPAVITAWALPDSTSSHTYYASFDFYEE